MMYAVEKNIFLSYVLVLSSKTELSYFFVDGF